MGIISMDVMESLSLYRIIRGNRHKMFLYCLSYRDTICHIGRGLSVSALRLRLIQVNPRPIWQFVCHDMYDRQYKKLYGDNL